MRRWPFENGRGPRWRPATRALDCGNSGTTLRLLAGALADPEALVRRAAVVVVRPIVFGVLVIIVVFLPIAFADFDDAIVRSLLGVMALAIILPMIGSLLVAVGLVVNVIAMTGVGNTLSLMIQQWAGGNLVIALVLVLQPDFGQACLILFAWGVMYFVAGAPMILLVGMAGLVDGA